MKQKAHDCNHLWREGGHTKPCARSGPLLSLFTIGSRGKSVSWGYHIHLSGITLVLGCLAHIGLHWQWFRAVLTGKAKGRIKLFMNSMVAILMLLAGLSGPAAVTSTAASRLHELAGSLALVGLFIHGVKHTRWMAVVAKKLITGRQENTSPSV